MSNAWDGLATLALATLVARVLRLGGRAIRRPGYYAALARRLMTVHGAVGAWQIALGRPRAAPLRCDISPRSPPPSAGAADPVRILLSQTILPPGGTARLEALAYTGDGTILAIASTARSEILLYRRQGDGRFGDRPALVLGGFMSGFGEPHGIDIFTREGQEFMAVANRLGWISLHRRLLSGTFARRPDHIIAGPRTELCDSDAVAAVPPFNDMLAVCNLTTGAVSFHRAGPEGNRAPPVAVLCHPHLHRPEGLAFSACGKFLAVG
ncbi:MAG: hypothetical protein NT133_24515, partial [Alphaproteobacteria bacterium]|nr:hypothetical protein [Alphaproteobacteria bacterium]